MKPPLTPRQLRRIAKERFLKSRRAEAWYRKNLFTVSSQVDALVRGWAPFHDIPGLRSALEQYSQVIRPWARVVTAQMHTSVSLRDLASWVELGRTMGKELRRTITSAPVGEAMREAMKLQVGLITSLPTEAAERVHQLTTQAIITSARADVIEAEILKTGLVTRSRARTIARTEVARTSSLLMESRAKYVGSTHYIWHTSEDADVRPSHRRLNSRTFAWASPPVTEDTGERAHPGQIWNCRCFLPDTQFSAEHGVKKLYRSVYRGNVCRVWAGGVSFVTTPNHPILTARGWVIAGKLERGDYLVQALSDPRGRIEKQEDHPLATFDDVFSSLSSYVEKAPGVLFDFYDRIPDGDVEQIPVEQLLALACVTRLAQSGSYLTFPEADRRVAESVIQRAALHVLDSGETRQSNTLAQSLLGHLRHADFIGDAAVPDGDLHLQQSEPDCLAIHSESLGEGQFTGAGKVLLDDLLCRQSLPIMASRNNALDVHASGAEMFAEDIRMHAKSSSGILEHPSGFYQLLPLNNKGVCEFPYSGHVFTLESDYGWYGVTPERIIAQNCWAEPILP